MYDRKRLRKSKALLMALTEELDSIHSLIQTDGSAVLPNQIPPAAGAVEGDAVTRMLQMRKDAENALEQEDNAAVGDGGLIADESNEVVASASSWVSGSSLGTAPTVSLSQEKALPLQAAQAPPPPPPPPRRSAPTYCPPKTPTGAAGAGKTESKARKPSASDAKGGKASQAKPIPPKKAAEGEHGGMLQAKSVGRKKKGKRSAEKRESPPSSEQGPYDAGNNQVLSRRPSEAARHSAHLSPTASFRAGQEENE